jgi:hypothetical protein
MDSTRDEKKRRHEMTVVRGQQGKSNLQLEEENNKQHPCFLFVYRGNFMED